MPARNETHAGEDVPIYATGPGAWMIHGVQEQSYVYYAMREALGWGGGEEVGLIEASERGLRPRAPEDGLYGRQIRGSRSRIGRTGNGRSPDVRVATASLAEHRAHRWLSGRPGSPTGRSALHASTRS